MTRRGTVLASFILIGLLVLFSTASHPEQVDAAQAQRVLKERCVICHNTQVAQASLRLDTFEALARGGITGLVVIPGKAEESPLYQRLVTTNRDHRMPPAMAPLPPGEIAVIKSWIDAGAAGLPRGEAPVSADFKRDVEPILRVNCYGCHSGAQPKSLLRLDAKAAAMKGGLSGTVIVPGSNAASRLIHRVEGKHGEQRMPLGRQPLPARQIAILKKWIDSGANWPEPRGVAARSAAAATIEKHWSYRQPVRPSLPQVRNAEQLRNPIDRFVLARLEAQGLQLSPEAPRDVLIRRLSLDLTGLPPTPAEIDEFLADSDPDAYRNLVGRLLRSQHYGERWARPWLDLARYADTNGYEKDRRRTMWKYRDWVIQALNADMPFDQFTIEQIAGDLLPDSTNGQKIATGFHRNTMYNEEGGVDKEEAHFEVLVDRVGTTGTVWLGSSLACAQCHNHKYDPFTQRDFYQLMAFFSNTVKKPQEYGDTSVKWTEPALDLATPDQETRRRQLKDRIKQLEDKLASQTPELDREQAEWERGVRDATSSWQVLAPTRMKAEAGTTLATGPAGVISAAGENPRDQTYVIEAPVSLTRITGLRLEALPDPSLPRGGPGRDTYGNFILSALRLEVNDKPVAMPKVFVDDGRTNDERARQLWIVDASREDTRLPRQMVLAVKDPPVLDRESTVRVTLVQNSVFVGQALGRFRLSVTGGPEPARIVRIRHKLRPMIEAGQQGRSPEAARQVSEFFRSVADSLAPARDELKEVNNQLNRLGIVTALVMAEHPGTEPLSDFLRIRGGFAAKGEKVFADVPAALGPMPPDAPKNRLGLARWLVSRNNPLTARVTVNRIWEQYFGRGLVETSEDFGAQGQVPAHPELLDWLAVEFMESGWSLKHLHQLIVHSAAYRQSSKASARLLQADPYNRWISRGPRFRMEAEMIRDVALAASGLLSRKIGGPSVFPFQPAGVWDVPYSDENWEESTGEDRYRRGLYTFVRRSATYPSMMNFDATSREFCTVRRTRTNTPLQALTTLNDPAFFEAARELAARMLREGGGTSRSRLEYGFRLCTSRHPQPAEVDRMLGWREREREFFNQHPDEAARLAPDSAEPAEQASWTMLANVLLNLDEALTKE
jgi:hypothetical protein